VVVLAHDDLRDRLGGLLAEMVASTRRGYCLGVSRSHPGPHGVRTAYDEARRALRLGDRVETTGDVTFYDDLGLLRLLAQIDDVELDLFVSDVLGPVLELSEGDRAALLQTLDSLLANNFNIAQSAREVHYHYNTLRHRLVKLERLLGPFSTDAPTSRRIGVALEILRMRGTWP
jgi:purine catabolism regulator